MSEPVATRARGSASLALRVLLAVGFVIAAGATALVILADDVQLLRLAAVLALWAALIAAFAVTRSRRDAKAAALREKDAHLAYQVELHREVSARHEYEADLAAQMAEAQSQQIAELREQLDRLTDVLTALADGEVFVSRMTLSAESARFRAGQALGPVLGPVALADDRAKAIGWTEPTAQPAQGVGSVPADGNSDVSPAERQHPRATPHGVRPRAADRSVFDAYLAAPAGPVAPEAAEPEPAAAEPIAAEPEPAVAEAAEPEPAAAEHAAAEPAKPEPAAAEPAVAEPEPVAGAPTLTGRRYRHSDDDVTPGGDVPWWRRAVDEAVRARNAAESGSEAAADPAGDAAPAAPLDRTNSVAAETEPPGPLPTPEPAPGPFRPEPLPEPLPEPPARPIPAPRPDPVNPPSPWPPFPDPVPPGGPGPVPEIPGGGDDGRAFSGAAVAASHGTAHDQPDAASAMSPEALLAAYGLTASPRRRRRD